MKWIVSKLGALLCLLRRSFLFIQGKDPVIVYFKFDHFINVNDLAFCLRWKTKHAWKAEIEYIGKVKRTGIIVFNNKFKRASLKLIIYGRGRRRLEYLLDLNLKKTSIQGCHFNLTNQIEKEIQFINTDAELILETISSSLDASTWNKSIALSIPPQITDTIELIKNLSLLANDQENFINNQPNLNKPAIKH
jgi:hypothetical protein